jgi:flagellar biosynthesis protein FlhF
MELKRIIARDGRSATEKAIALYGEDVLIVATHPLDGQTELIVAVDIPATNGEAGPATTRAKAAAPARSPVNPPASIGAQAFQAFDEAMQLVRDAAPEVARASAERPPQEHAAHRPPAADTGSSEARALETFRGREIVDLVRQELAALRQEFNLSRQLSSWQSGLELSAALTPLADALHEIAVPAGLRALLLDSIGQCDSAADGLARMHSLLCSSLPQAGANAPTTGVHALCGPSGAGKTLMLARLAAAACNQLAPEHITLISFNDARPGAWSQLQMLAAQSGVECMRARDAATLALMLEELQTRSLVLIDTAGVDHSAQAASLAALQHPVTLHAVLPVDASITSVRRLLQAPARPWASLMLTKLDEAGHPWPLIQGLTEFPLPISAVGDAEHSNQSPLAFDAQRLVNLALVPLQERINAEPVSLPRAGVRSAASSTRRRTPRGTTTAAIAAEVLPLPPLPASAPMAKATRNRSRTQKVQHG